MQETTSPVPFTMDSTTAMTMIAVTVAVAILFFVPTIIAVIRKHPSRGLIFVVNLLGGSTGIGWIVAFVWSLTTPEVKRNAFEDGLTAMTRMKALLEQGVLTEPEFQAIKQKYLAAA